MVNNTSIYSEKSCHPLGREDINTSIDFDNYVVGEDGRVVLSCRSEDADVLNADLQLILTNNFVP